MSVQTASLYGKAYRPTFSANIALNHRIARLWVLAPTTGSLVATLPDATLLRTGLSFFLVNPTGTSFDVNDDGGTTLATIAGTSQSKVGLVDNTNADGSWVFSSGQIQTPQNPDFFDLLVPFTTQVDTAAPIETLDEGTTSDLAVPFTTDVVSNFPIVLDTLAPTDHLVSAAATGGGDGTSSAPFTLREACERSDLGPYYLRDAGGDYPDSVTHAFDSTVQTFVGGTSSTARKVFNAYPGDTPTLLRRARFEGATAQHVQISGLRFESPNGAPWIYVRDGASDIVVSGCSFDDTSGAGAQGSVFFNGIFIRSVTDVIIEGCSFEQWYGVEDNAGDMIRLQDCSRVTIRENDFSGAQAGNSIIHGYNVVDDCEIYLNVFKNDWNRVLGYKTNSLTTTGLKGNLIECNVFLESNDPLSSFPQPSQGSHTMRFGGVRPIIRNNLFYDNQVGNDGANNADIGFEVLTDSVVTYKARVYHNTAYASDTGGVGIIQNYDGSQSIIGLKFFNNVFRQTIDDKFLWALSLSNPEVVDVPWEGWEIDHNILRDTASTTDGVIKIDPVPVTDEFSVLEAETFFPSTFHDNIITDPSFVSASKPSPTTDIETWYANFALAAASAGENGGRELSRTTASGSSTTTVPVTDAACFWPGGGHADEASGDLVVIGSSTVRVTGVDFEANTITVDQTISFASNVPVYLAVMGSAMPDMGIWGVLRGNAGTPAAGPDEDPPPPPPPTQGVEYLDADSVSDKNDWSVSGTTDKVAAVTGLDDGTYVFTSTNAATQRYNVAAPSVIQAGDSIDDVQVEIRRRKLTSGSGSNIQIGIRLGGSTTDTTLLSLPGPNFETAETTDLERPGGGTWTVADLSDLEFYFRNINTFENQVSRIRLKVNYTTA